MASVTGRGSQETVAHALSVTRKGSRCREFFAHDFSIDRSIERARRTSWTVAAPATNYRKRARQMAGCVDFRESPDRFMAKGSHKARWRSFRNDPGSGAPSGILEGSFRTVSLERRRLSRATVSRLWKHVSRRFTLLSPVSQRRILNVVNHASDNDVIDTVR